MQPYSLTAASRRSEVPESKDWPSNLTSGMSVRCLSVRMNVHDTTDVYVSFPWDLVRMNRIRTPNLVGLFCQKLT